MPSGANLDEILRSHNDMILQHLPVGLFTIDTLGRVSLANSALLEMLGSPGAHATLGLNVLELPTIRAAGVDEPIRRVLRTGQHANGTTRYTSLWGKRTSLADQLLPLRETVQRGRPAGPVVGLLAILRDATQEEEARQRLEQTVQDLEQANQERRALDARKDHVLANVTHELRTPLVTLLGYLEMMETGRLGTVPEGWERPLRTARQRAEQLQDLIERLLCLTEQPAAAGEVVAKPVELRPLVEEELAVRREASPPARLPITWQPPADEEPPAPLVASGEPRRLRRILRGLLDNALAFAREQVAVSLERTVEGEVPCLRLIVDDDGPGIPPEHRELVFTTFFQVDQAPTRRHDGLGLGLPVARKLAAEMGGRIHATASPLGGARLVLELRQAQLAVPSP